MATILGLALKINADATGVPRQLTTVEKALQSLENEATKVTGVFSNFAKASGAAADVQQKFQAEINALTEALKAGDINGQQFADGFAAIKQEAAATADAFAEGARISEKYRSEQDKIAETTARLDRLLQVGAITQSEYNAEMMAATGVNAQIAKAERERADLSTRAARVLEANLTASQRAQNAYNMEIQEYQTLLRAGAISQDDFNKAVERSAASFAKATVEANKTGNAIDAAGKGGKLQFNELSGILSALPGPLGNVAGRFSGLASAGEGLSRVFSGGLAAGFSGIGASVAALVNPFTVAAGAIAGVGLAATKVVSGLSSLAGNVEQLGFAARQAGVDFQTIQVLDEAATRAGVSVEALATGVQKFGARLADAAKGSGETFNALQQLGFSLEQIQQGQNDPTEFAGRVAKALEQIPEPARQAQLQIDILGRGGESLVRAFGEIEGSAIAIRRFGGAINDLDQQRLLALDGAFENLQRSILGLGREVLTPFIGITQSITDGLAPAVATFSRNIGAVLDIFSPLTSAVGAITNLFLQFGSVVGNLIGTVLEPFATAGRVMSAGIDAISASFTAIGTRVNDAVLGFREFFQFEGVAAAFRDTFAQIGEVVSRVGTIITTAFTQIAGLVGETFGRVTSVVGEAVSQFLEFTGLGDALSAIGSTISSVFGTVSSVFQTIAGAIGGTVGRLLTMAENFLGIERSAESAASGVDQVTQSTAQLTEEQKRAAGEVQKAVENSAGVLDKAIQKAGEFGQAGFEAAFQFQQALADLKEQADANELNAEQYSRGVALATAEFDKQIERLQKIQNETRKAAEEAQRRVDADRQVADALLEQARINSQFGGDASRAKAADAVLAVEREIAQIKERVAAARDSGDATAVMAGEERIRQLTEIAQQQSAIADGSAKAAADEAKRVEDQKRRVDELIRASDTRSELEQQLIDVQEQQKITLDQLIIARQQFNEEQANAAAGRLAQLDQLQAKLEEQQQAVEQGFGQGFTQAFQETDKGIDALIVKAQEFGTVGALAAQALEQGIAQAQEQARAGILTQETYQREVAQQRDIFQQRLDAAQRVEEFLRNGVDQRQQAELKATAELEQRKKEAAVNVQAIEAKLIEQRKQLEQAREDGDLRGARAAQTRINQLDRVQRQEQQLADGRIQQQREVGQQFLGGVSAAQRFQGLVAQQNDNFLRSFNNAYAGANQALAANAAAAAEQAAKLEQLLTPTNQLAQTADIRTQQGQQLLLDITQRGQDPSLVEARLQTKQLQTIAQGISQAASNYFNSPVAIVGGAALG